jgi:hypothetical protein
MGDPDMPDQARGVVVVVVVPVLQELPEEQYWEMEQAAIHQAVGEQVDTHHYLFWMGRVAQVQTAR